VEQTKNRDLAKALAEKTAHSETVRSQLETARQEAERLRSEVKKLRDDLAARDASLAQERQALAGAATARSALAVEQTKNRDLAKALAEKAAQVDTARSQLETSRSQVDTARSQVEIARQDSGRLQAELKTARDAIAASDASLVQERQALAAALARATALDAELRAAPMQAKTVATYWRPEFDQNRTYELEPPEELEPANEPVAAQLRESKHAAQILESSSPLGAPPNVGLIRALCVGLVALMLAVLFWSFVHHSLSAAKAPVVPAAPPAAGAVVRDCATCPPLTVLPAGQFLQGSGGTASGVRPNETPQHWVAIARSFAMSTNPVTVDEFRAFVASTGRQMQGCDTYDGDWRVRPENSWQNPGFVQTGSHPVTCASWEDAKAYAAWLSARTGHRYRLPSASEWEYAARAGSGAIRPWAADGSDACVSANVADASAARQFPGWTVFACDDGYVNTAPVGSFKANAFGLNDMLGNVFQWTEDCWHADYTGAPIDGSARTDGDCSEHELRGGSWFTSPDLVRANYRNHFAAAYRTSSVGIRLVRDLEP
jgi:formylglycine-generating enzyme required for sulfatase activity